MSLFALIAPVGDGWPQSRLLLKSINEREVLHHVVSMDGGVTIFILVMLCIFILFFRRSIVGITGSFVMASGHYRTKELIDDQYFSDSSVVAMLLLMPFYACAFITTSATSLSYWLTLLTIAAYILLRYLITFVIAWISGNSQILELRKCFNGFCVLLMSISTLIIPVKVLVPSLGPQLAVIFLSAVCVAVNLLYFVRSYKIIISSGFSHFFWFLYLCGLEILPISVVFKVLLS